jgi:hypothetical protein
MSLHPAIGILSTGVHYAFLDGYRDEPFMGSREDVERALGLSVEPQVAQESAMPAKAAQGLRDYEVRISLPMPVYSGAVSSHTSTERVSASSRNEAIKQARAQYRESQGRHAPAPTITARLVRS